MFIFSESEEEEVVIVHQETTKPTPNYKVINDLNPFLSWLDSFGISNDKVEIMEFEEEDEEVLMVPRSEAKHMKEYMAIRKFLLWNVQIRIRIPLTFFSVKIAFEHFWRLFNKVLDSITLFQKCKLLKNATVFDTVRLQTFLELNLQMTKTEQNWRSLRPSRGCLRQKREEKFA